MARLIYPGFPDSCDLVSTRIGEAGLGNCFFLRVHAFRLLRAKGVRILGPTRRSIRTFPLLRGEPTLRHYSHEAMAHPGWLQGAYRLWLFVVTDRRFSDAFTRAGAVDSRSAERTGLIRAGAARFAFLSLHKYRANIRDRVLGTRVNRPQPLLGRPGGISQYMRDRTISQWLSLVSSTRGKAIICAHHSHRARRLSRRFARKVRI